MMSQTRVDPIRLASIGLSSLLLLALAAMLGLLLWQSAPVWQHEGLGYVTGKTWFFRQEQFGALAMLWGTVVVAIVAVGLAAPLGIGAAIFTSEIASEILPPWMRTAIKVLIELLAGIPSVVYGLLGVLVLRGYVYDALTWLGLDPLSGDTLLTAGLLLAIMILPTVMTLADDALRSVPANQRMAARGLGLTRAQVIVSTVLPAARPGLIAAVLLGLGRALGETIAVFLVVGRQDNQFPGSLFRAGQTLTSKLGGAETNLAYGNTLHWAAIVGLGVLLLVMTLLVTFAGRLLRGRHG